MYRRRETEGGGRLEDEKEKEEGKSALFKTRTQCRRIGGP